MLRLVQIIRHLSIHNLSRKFIDEKLQEIINNEDEYFILDEEEIEKIASILKDRRRTEGAFLVGMESRYTKN